MGVIRIIVALAILIPTGYAYAENRKKIYVLDSGISAPYATAKYMCTDHLATSVGGTEHGDNVTSIIGLKIDISNYCVYPVNVFPNGKYSQARVNRALYNILHDSDVVGLNMSLSGAHNETLEFQLLRSISHKLKVVVAAGNDNLDLKPGDCQRFPACYGLVIKSNFYVVEASDIKTDNRPHFKHYSAPGRRRGVNNAMTGTSQACAEFTGNLFKKD
jgi:hypothetical protein